MSQAADDELVARFQRLCGAAAGRSEAVAAPAADRKEAERLLQEMLEAEQAIATDDGPPCSFPSAPTAAVPEQQSTRPAAIALRAHAETLWCHICRLDAHVWCADCSNVPFCAKCWRETHTPAWTDPALRRHRTVVLHPKRVAQLHQRGRIKKAREGGAPRWWQLPVTGGCSAAAAAGPHGGEATCEAGGCTQDRRKGTKPVGGYEARGRTRDEHRRARGRAGMALRVKSRGRTQSIVAVRWDMLHTVTEGETGRR